MKPTPHTKQPPRRKPFGRALRLLSYALALSLSLPVAADPSRAESPDDLEYRIKAAYLYNFGRFVVWPQGAGAPSRPFVLGILGDQEFGDLLQHTVRGKELRGRAVRARQISTIAEARECDLVFISSSKKRDLTRILSDLRGSGVLTIGEVDAFLNEGGMVNFVIERDTVRFDVNLDAIQSAGFEVSSQLLKVARDIRFKKR